MTAVFKRQLYLLVLGAILSSVFMACGNTNQSATQQDTLSTTPLAIIQQAVVIAPSGLVLRSSPQPFFDNAYLVPYNAIVKVLAQTNKIETHQATMGKWYKITHNQRTGYVFGGYLEIGTQLVLPKLYPTVEKIFDTDSSGIKQRALVSTKTKLVLRSVPSTSATSVALIAPNEEVGVLKTLETSETVEARQGSWCKVRFRAQEGYIFSGFLTFTKARVKSENGAKMRQKPDLNSTMELFIPKDRVVFLLNDAPIRQGFIGKTEGWWYKIAYQRKQGYVFSADLEMKGY